MLKAIVIRTLVNALALWIAAWIVPGIEFGQNKEWTSVVGTVVVVALVFGLINALVKPIVHLFSLPLIWLTLGLFTVVVNALMLMLTSWIADSAGLAFHVDGFFWSAVLGAIVISVVSMILNVVVPDGQSGSRARV